MIEKIKTLTRWNLIALIFAILLTLYLLVAIPNTMSGLSFRKQRILESFEKETDKNEVKKVVETEIKLFQGAENYKIFLLSVSGFFIFLSFFLFLGNFLIFRNLRTQSAKEISEKK